jgi:hypothetical protein
MFDGHDHAPDISSAFAQRGENAVRIRGALTTLLSAVAVAAAAAPIADAALHVSVPEARLQIRRALLNNDATYRTHVGTCTRISSAKVRCRAHTWNTDQTGDYECDVLGTVTAISNKGRGTYFTRTHNAHCHST